jgi:hypothetical protein
MCLLLLKWTCLCFTVIATIIARNSEGRPDQEEKKEWEEEDKESDEEEEEKEL